MSKHSYKVGDKVRVVKVVFDGFSGGYFNDCIGKVYVVEALWNKGVVISGKHPGEQWYYEEVEPYVEVEPEQILFDKMKAEIENEI